MTKQQEIESECARLIASGVPHWEAMQQARNTIENRMNRARTLRETHRIFEIARDELGMPVRLYLR